MKGEEVCKLCHQLMDKINEAMQLVVEIGLEVESEGRLGYIQRLLSRAEDQAKAEWEDQLKLNNIPYA